MTAFIGWLLGSSGVLDGPLVWVSGGVGIAVVLTVLLLATVAVLAWHREPLAGEIPPGKRLDLPRSRRVHLPSAA